MTIFFSDFNPLWNAMSQLGNVFTKIGHTQLNEFSENPLNCGKLSFRTGFKMVFSPFYSLNHRIVPYRMLKYFNRVKYNTYSKLIFNGTMLFIRRLIL